MTESLLLLPSVQLALWQQPHAYGHTNCLSSKTSCSSWYRGRRPQSARVFRQRCMSTLHNVIHVYTLSMFWPSSTCCWRSWRGLVGSCLQIWWWVLTYWQVDFAVGKLTSRRVGCCCHLLPASVCVCLWCAHFQVWDVLMNGDMSPYPSFYTNCTGSVDYFNYLRSSVSQ